MSKFNSNDNVIGEPSSEKWSNLMQIKCKIQKNFTVKIFLKPIANFQNFLKTSKIYS